MFYVPATVNVPDIGLSVFAVGLAAVHFWLLRSAAQNEHPRA